MTWNNQLLSAFFHLCRNIRGGETLLTISERVTGTRVSQKAQMPGAQKLRSEVPVRVRRNGEVAAQRRRWTFYETIALPFLTSTVIRSNPPTTKKTTKETMLSRLEPVICPTIPKTAGPMIPANFELTS
jgi:hypothetical protein